MEAAEETLTYRDDTGLHKKLLPEGKDNCGKEIKEQVDARSNESNYMDTKTDCAKTVKVSFTGEGNQLSVSKCDGSKQAADKKSVFEESRDTVRNEPSVSNDFKDTDFDQLPKDDGCATSASSQRAQSESDELRYTDMYLNSKTEDEDDEASALLSDHYRFDTGEDESHYITTHEIQLTELDHDVDYDLGRGTRWEFEDDNLVYSFVDYATLESDNTHEGTLILEEKSATKVQANLRGRVVSTEQDESDLLESDKFASSDESFCKNQRDAGKIQLSIQTASRVLNDPLPLLDSGDKGHLSLVSSGARAGPLCDRAQYFIPAPGRQHLATKLRRKDINEYSSGASSSISELDDADKEVRNLTAKSFRSLACPYFDAINLSTSSESSISEYGLNKWAFVDWNYRNISRSKEHSIISHKTTTLERNQNAENKINSKSIAQIKCPESNNPPMDNREPSIHSSSSSKPIEFRGPVQDNCDVEKGVLEGSKHAKTFSAQYKKVPGAVLTRSECEMQYHHTDDRGDTQKKAIFASSLLKNVISKKMQFEKERKMERGEIHDTHSGLVPSLPDVMKVRDLKSMQRQTSESGSGFTGNSTEDLYVEGSRASSCEPTDEGKNRKDQESNKEQLESPCLKAPSSQTHHTSEIKEAEKNTNNMLTKLLFVPRCQLYSKDKDFSKDLSSANSTGKTPEIKICLRSVKENKGCTLNIASLLTPQISYSTVNTLRAAGQVKCPIVSASDKMPSFTVRDVRDTKCKFQTPIYQVRDVRKLVKSSYRFVSLDNSDNKHPPAVSTAANIGDTSKESVKQQSATPIIIQCNSIKTNIKQKSVDVSQRETEAGRSVPTVLSDPASSETNPGLLQGPFASDHKPVKHRLERISGESLERKNVSKIPKQAALEKLTAAVRSMEQLYVFDRNEWKRKNQALHPVAGSHVLSLITKEEQREEGDTERAHPTPTYKPHTKAYMNVMNVPYNNEAQPQLNTEDNKSALHSGHRVMPHTKAPKCGQVKASPRVAQASLDSENYLTIPGLTPDIKALSGVPGTKEDNANKDETCKTKLANKKRSPLIMEYPASNIYHHSTVVPQHVLCFSPSIPTVSPTPSGGDTHRKMLLDPTTGQYYLVDTPVQTTKRLFDPDTGQFVDVPMSHSPVSPVTSVTPVPLSVSPLAPVLPQSPCHSEEATREKLKSAQQKETNSPVIVENVYYSASGEPSPSEQLSSTVGHVITRGRTASSERKPIISISTPQGPRIIAPPSFDGTTMSFVVEHR
uniref:DUF4585 domain-containing protein n=1 Tax=Neogobius melanostomus TaxID=47308 RepID=A0A8C6T095_9GOBI